MLLSLRDCVLRPTKRMIFERGVAESTVRIKKTEDDYDYPETLRIVGLDRTRANDARAAPVPYMRLDGSIFGQLFAALVVGIARNPSMKEDLFTYTLIGTTTIASFAEEGKHRPI